MSVLTNEKIFPPVAQHSVDSEFPPLIDEYRGILSEDERCRVLSEDERCRVLSEDERCRVLSENERCRVLSENERFRGLRQWMFCRRRGDVEGVVFDCLGTPVFVDQALELVQRRVAEKIRAVDKTCATWTPQEIRGFG
jgi:hypothetical protein